MNEHRLRDGERQGMTILLVDDDPEIRLIAGILLRSAGHEVVDADSAASAAARLHEQHTDLVLMDVMLGEEDGVTVAAGLLRGLAEPPTLVFLTGATRAEQIARMTAAGAAGIVHKPFDPETFVRMVEQYASGA